MEEELDEIMDRLKEFADRADLLPLAGDFDMARMYLRHARKRLAEEG